MNRVLKFILTTGMLLGLTQIAAAQGAQPDMNPDVPPGTETPQGDLLRQGKTLQPLVPDVQPGVETPQGDVSSGDEDDIDDLEIERLTVRGVTTPGATTNMPGAAPAKSMAPLSRPEGTRRNYGTIWTGWIDDPNADVNPCQKGLERGEQKQVKTYKSGETAQYDVQYECYLLVPAPRPAVASATARKKCGTAWTGWIDDPDADVNPCSTGCEPGEQQIVDAGIKSGVKQYNVRYQCYVAEPAPAGAVSSQPAISASQRPTGSPGGMTAGGTAPTTQPSMDPSQSPTAGLGGQTPAIASPAGPFTPVPAGGITGRTSPSAPGTLPGVTDRQVSTASMEGAGTTITGITDVTITTLMVKWKPVPGVRAYVLHAVATGLNNSVTGPEIQQPPTLPSEMAASLEGLATGVENTVWVSLDYPDGRTGTSDRRTVTMLPAENPRQFTATVTGTSSVHLTWQPSTGAIHYFIEGDNLPRLQTTDTSVEVSNLTAGTHGWSLVAAYPAGLYDAQNPSRATANIAASESQGKYRITLLGFTANKATWDNALQTDGKGDEIFVSCSLQLVDGSGNSQLGGMEPVLRSYIYGDVWGQNAPNRRPGGQASDNGGFADGSSLPPVPYQGTPNSSDPLSIPMVLWSGTLIQGQNAVILTPTLWEYDGTSMSGVFQDWTTWAGRIANVFANPQKFLQVAGYQIPTTIDLGGMGAGLAIDLQESLLGSDGDRPVGMQSENGHGVFKPKSIVFTQAVAETMLEQGIGSLPQGVYPISYQDDPKWHGDYTVYLRVERLP